MTGPVCPYCRMPFEETGPVKVFCTACGTPHHEDCYRENGGCTVFGCARAPADDPKLQVSHSDLRSVSIPAQPYAPGPQPYVPVPVSTQPAAPSPYGSSPLGLSQAASAASATAPASPAPGAQAPPPASANIQPPPPPSANMQPPPPAPYGYQYSQAQYSGYQYGAPPLAYAHPPKSRTTYIVLGIFLGALGIHNFYAGYTGRAVGQLCLTVLTLGSLGIVSWIWAIVEICILDKDGAGVPFQ